MYFLQNVFNGNKSMIFFQCKTFFFYKKKKKYDCFFCVYFSHFILSGMGGVFLVSGDEISYHTLSKLKLSNMWDIVPYTCNIFGGYSSIYLQHPWRQ